MDAFMSRILTLLAGALLVGGFLLSYAVNDGRCGTSPLDATHGVVPIFNQSAASAPDTMSDRADTAPAFPAPAFPASQEDHPLDDHHEGEGCLFTPVNPLSFGGIFTSPLSGTVTVNPDGTANYTGGVYAHTGVVGGNPNAALIELTLENPEHCTQDDHCQNDNDECDRNEDDDHAVNDYHQTFTRHGMDCSLTISSPTKLTRTGGNETMTADNYIISRTKGDISIGATLHVGANQASGSYCGVFYVMLSYE